MRQREESRVRSVSELAWKRPFVAPICPVSRSRSPSLYLALYSHMTQRQSLLFLVSIHSIPSFIKLVQSIYLSKVDRGRDHDNAMTDMRVGFLPA